MAQAAEAYVAERAAAITRVFGTPFRDLAPGNDLVTIPRSGRDAAYSVAPLLRPEACDALCRFVRPRLEVLCSAEPPVPRNAPTLHAAHVQSLLGVDAGLNGFVSQLIANALMPWARAAFKVHIDPRHFLAFIVEHSGDDSGTTAVGAASVVEQTPLHRDQSVVTFNVCVDDPHEDVAAGILLCPGADDGDVAAVVPKSATAVAIPRGHALMHAGDTLHGAAYPAGYGRTNLVIYCIPPPPPLPVGRASAAHLFRGADRACERFYVAYVAYLAEKEARATAGSAGSRSCGFRVPMLPGWAAGEARRLCRRIARRLPALGSAAEAARDALVASPSAPQSWWHHAHVLATVASFTPHNDRASFDRVAHQWHDACRELHAAAAPDRWRRVLDACVASGATAIESSHDKALVAVGVGNAGRQCVAHYVEALCVAYGVRADGCAVQPGCHAPSACFTETAAARVRARSVLIDTAPEDDWGFSVGPGHWWSDVLGAHVAGRHDAAGIFWQRAVAPSVMDDAVDALRRELEAAPQLQGVLLFSSLGGGTGAGLSAALVERCADELRSGSVVYTAIAPSLHRDTAAHTAAYNTLLSFNAPAIARAALVALCDGDGMHACRPPHSRWCPAAHAELIGTALLSATTGMRTGGALNATLPELVANLAPFRGMHYVVPSLAPLCWRLSAAAPVFASDPRESVMRLTRFAVGLHASCTLATVDAHARRLATTLQFHGSVAPKDIMAAVAAIKTHQTIRFVDWVPTGFRCGTDYAVLPATPSGSRQATPVSLGGLTNTAGGLVGVERACDAARRLFQSRAFVHHYATGAGVEEGEFAEALDHAAATFRDYQEAGASDDDDDDDDEIGSDEY